MFSLYDLSSALFTRQQLCACNGDAKNRRQSYLESLQKSVHRLSSALSSEPQKWKSVLCFWHLTGIENASPAKGIFGILNLAKIRCGIRENARYLNRERDITATREARFATGCGIFLPVYREFGKSYLLRGKRESTQRLTVDSFQTKL